MRSLIIEIIFGVLFIDFLSLSYFDSYLDNFQGYPETSIVQLTCDDDRTFTDGSTSQNIQCNKYGKWDNDELTPWDEQERCIREFY